MTKKRKEMHIIKLLLLLSFCYSSVIEIPLRLKHYPSIPFNVSASWAGIPCTMLARGSLTKDLYT